MHNYPTRGTILSWHLKREGLLGAFRLGGWLLLRPRLYQRLWGIVGRAFGHSQQADEQSTAEWESWDCPEDFCMSSDRLLLRPMAVGDLDDVAALNPADMSWRDRMACTGDLLKGWITFVAEARDSGEVVAQFTLTPFNIDGESRMELGYRVAPALFNQGLATEGASLLRDFALVTVGLDSLIAVIEPGNTASIRVAEKLGMTCEREWELQGVPVHVYGMTYREPVII